MRTDNISTPYGVCHHTKYEGGPTCIHDAYLRGYEDAEKTYTNNCFMCGYAGEWSTWTCDDCDKTVTEGY